MRDWDHFLPFYMHGTQDPSATSGHAFLALLKGHGQPGFTATFVRICMRLDLGGMLSATELKQLYAASLFATLCSIAFNGLGGCGGVIKPQLELQRIVLEQDFMEAKSDLSSTQGWRALSAELKKSTERIFLRVVVDDGNLES